MRSHHSVLTLIIPLCALLAMMHPTAAATDNSAQELPSISVVGTQLPSDSYVVPNATTATKIDTPIMETPMSIQVVPQQVLQDQQVTRFEQAVKNVSGVYQSSIFQGQSADDFVIRGFELRETVYRDGYRISTGQFGKRDLANVEQLEIVKGPASVLYGRIEPGGLVNYVTKQPLTTPQYAFEQQVGSFDFYRTTLDATGPISADKALTYRFNLAYENAGSFREFVSDERWFAAPVLQWNVSPHTQITMSLDHFQNATVPDNVGLIALGNRPAPIPIERNLGEPTDFQNSTDDLVNITATHEFNTAWMLRAHFDANIRNEKDGGAYGDFGFADPPDNTILSRQFESATGLSEKIDETNYAVNIDLVGKFKTASLDHTLLLGGDYYHTFNDTRCCGFGGNLVIADINVYNPVHGVTLGPSPLDLSCCSSKGITKWYGLYLQDQVELPHHLFALAGFRYDNTDERNTPIRGDATVAADDAVTPRGGLLWRPLQWLSLYGSYTENFGVTNGTSIDSAFKPLPPETAQQWELGFKTEFLDGRVTGSFAYYDLTKQNISAPDPINPILFSRAIGEANSHGVELDIAAAITANCNILANYAYTEAVVTQDVGVIFDPVTGDAIGTDAGNTGKRFPNAPRHGGRVWTTYNVAGGPLAGAMFGGGVTMRSEREGDIANDFQLPGYATVDLMAGYNFKLGQSRATLQLNIYNLLDKRYFESSDEFGTARIAPGAPQTFLGSIRIDL